MLVSCKQLYTGSSEGMEMNLWTPERGSYWCPFWSQTSLFQAFRYRGKARRIGKRRIEQQAKKTLENGRTEQAPPLPSLPVFSHLLSPVRVFPHYLNACNRLESNYLYNPFAATTCTNHDFITPCLSSCSLGNCNSPRSSTLKEKDHICLLV